MNREIKFRAWDPTRKRMLDSPKWFEIRLSKDGTIRAFNYDYEGQEQELELIQYTGLKDRDGVEIYEFSELDFLYEVQYEKCKYILLDISSGDIIDLYSYLESKNGQVTVAKEYTKV